MKLESDPEMPSDNTAEAPEALDVWRSKEGLKFKGEIENMGKAVEALAFDLKNRSDAGFTDFVDADDIGRIAGVQVELGSLDVQTDTNLEQTTKLLGDLNSLLKGIEIRPSREGVIDDLDSLQELVWKVGEISTVAGNIEFAAKELDTPEGVELSKLAEEIAGVAKDRAEYLFQKMQMLAQYFGQ